VGGGLRSERVAQNDLAFVELPVRDPLVVTAGDTFNRIAGTIGSS